MIDGGSKVKDERERGNDGTNLKPFLSFL